MFLEEFQIMYIYVILRMIELDSGALAIAAMPKVRLVIIEP